MTIKKLPGAPEGRPRADVRSHVSARALAKWDSAIVAADDKEAERSISIYDVIGYDYWTGEGVTAKRVAAALRSMGAGPVTVNMNSPGGDLFEGIAIYNLLREHQGAVTIKVIGLAASAASIIAMAGDTVQVARAGFLMIHNVWTIAIGNRHDFREIADTIEPFDAALADIYAARTGKDPKALAKMMDAETWIGGSAAVDEGFADELLPSDQVDKSEKKASAAAVRKIEAALRSTDMPRSEAERLISEFKSSLRAGSGEGDPTERGAGDPAAISEAAALAASLTTMIPR